MRNLAHLMMILPLVLPGAEEVDASLGPDFRIQLQMLPVTSRVRSSVTADSTFSTPGLRSSDQADLAQGRISRGWRLEATVRWTLVEFGRTRLTGFAGGAALNLRINEVDVPAADPNSTASSKRGRIVTDTVTMIGGVAVVGFGVETDVSAGWTVGAEVRGGLGLGQIDHPSARSLVDSQAYPTAVPTFPGVAAVAEWSVGVRAGRRLARQWRLDAFAAWQALRADQTEIRDVSFGDGSGGPITDSTGTYRERMVIEAAGPVLGLSLVWRY